MAAALSVDVLWECDLKLAKSGWESLAAGEALRSRCQGRLGCEDGGGELSTLLAVEGRREEEGPPSLKMWTVSVAEETQRREEVALKDMQ
jgi:hypothetical protein